MSTSPATPRSRRWLRVLLWTGGLMTLSLVIVAVAVFNLVTLSRDAAALREALVANLGARPGMRVQIDAGPATLCLARFALRFIHDLPVEARLGARAVQAASVGVYEFDREPADANRSHLLAAADRAMDRRGWSRVLAVSQAHELVLAYVPVGMRAAGTQRFCLSVCNGRKLVVVSGAADSDALLELCRMPNGREAARSRGERSDSPRAN